MISVWICGWTGAIILVAVTAATCAWLARELPLQNVILASAVVAILGTAFDGFGWLLWTRCLGLLHNGVADDWCWTSPLIWLVTCLNARGLVRRALARWRGARNFGLFVLGAASVLAALSQAMLGLLGVRIGLLHQALSSYDMTKALLLFLLQTTWLTGGNLLILALAAPALIRK